MRGAGGGLANLRVPEVPDLVGMQARAPAADSGGIVNLHGVTDFDSFKLSEGQMLGAVDMSRRHT